MAQGVVYDNPICFASLWCNSSPLRTPPSFPFSPNVYYGWVGCHAPAQLSGSFFAVFSITGISPMLVPKFGTLVCHIIKNFIF